jgi:DNA-binding PadR family transcriptional regulator
VASSLNDFELLILLALIRLQPDAYGVPIAREIEERGKRSVALGSVYAVVERLEKRRLVRSELGEVTAERGGCAKRYFHITPKGLRETRAPRDSLIRMWRGVRELERDEQWRVRSRPAGGVTSGRLCGR